MGRGIIMFGVGWGGGLVGGQGAVVGVNQNFHRFKGEAERSMTD